MKKVTFNKAQETVICLFCNKNRVPLADWNKRCKDCKAKLKVEQKKEEKKQAVIIGKRLPAAIIQPTIDNKATGEQVFVDKFGKEVDGYTLKQDFRGRSIETKLKERTVIK